VPNRRGRGFSPRLQSRKDRRLVTTGVRELVCHLMRVAHLLWAVAQLSTNSNSLSSEDSPVYVGDFIRFFYLPTGTCISVTCSSGGIPSPHRT
jgi:protein-S-isoprenylcysteine O-methyltransferase Ste14